jgi:hypothetical protein
MANGIRVETERDPGAGRAIARNVAVPGFTQTVRWNGVAGATSAEVQEANVVLSPEVAEETTQDVPFTNEQGWVVTVPQRKRVKSITLRGLRKTPGPGIIATEITDTAELGDDIKLAVSFPPVQGSRWESPRFTVPAVSAVKMVPKTLTGATFSNSVLSLKDSVPATRVRVSLVKGGAPQDFDVQPAEISKIHLSTETAAHNIKLIGPEGNTLWQLPEFDPSATSVDVDIRAVLELALNAQIKNQQPLEAAFTVSADAPAKAFVGFGRIKGALLRIHEGILRTELTGDPIPLALGDALASESPQSVTGDLTIQYSGIRILESVSDEPPEAGAAVSGVTAGEAGVLKIFSPLALEGITPARVGIIGRAAEDCELSLEFVSVDGGIAGVPLGPPGILKLKADKNIRTRWIDVPAGIVLSGATGLRVRGNRGRFFWVSRDQPLARVAVRDPDPAGRPLFVGAVRLKAIVESNSHEPAFRFPAAGFSTAAPALRSDLFLTVDISDLTLRYQR